MCMLRVVSLLHLTYKSSWPYSIIYGQIQFGENGTCTARACIIGDGRVPDITPYGGCFCGERILVPHIFHFARREKQYILTMDIGN